MKNILITGFSGSGKSSVLELVAKRVKSNKIYLIDLDTEVLGQLGTDSLKEWFVGIEASWEKYRESEVLALAKVLENNHRSPKVIALGGGTKLSANIIKENEVIWLNTPLKDCFKRINQDPNRPLYYQKSFEEVARVYHERLKSYQKFRRYNDPEAMVAYICSKLLVY